MLVLTNVSSKEVLERWEFKIENETTTSADGTVKFVDETSKDEKTIKGEIRDVIRYSKIMTARRSYLEPAWEPSAFKVTLT